ncbi:MAG: HPr(Ser) kinase/phosphatase [Bacteroidota bacterium]|jgi:HPr kinase/phosphorylase
MSMLEKIKAISKEEIYVEILMKSPVQLTPLTGNIGLENLISDKNLHRPQLALAGFVELFTYHRVQIFGNTELYYLQSLQLEDRISAFENISRFSIPCIIITNNHQIDNSLIEIAVKQNIAVFVTPFETTKTIALLSDFLDDQFADQAVVHGSFVDVYGVGVLLVGRSGIGKSEIALDLIERGHRLVADDIIMFTKKRENILMGTGTSLVKHFMEIRGLGIINVQKMFGIRAIRYQKRLEIIVELEEWDKDKDYTRTGLDEVPSNLLNVPVSTVKLPIFAGKNVTVITEVIALNYLLKTYGYNAAGVFADKLQEEIYSKQSKGKSAYDQRLISYFQSDDE